MSTATASKLTGPAAKKLADADNRVAKAKAELEEAERDRAKLRDRYRAPFRTAPTSSPARSSCAAPRSTAASCSRFPTSSKLGTA